MPRLTQNRGTGMVLVPLLMAAALSVSLLGTGGCVQTQLIPGTRIADTKEHREVINRVEEYRVSMEQRNAAQLLAMASPSYYEDSGTPKGDDDYGYPGLKRVLDMRLAAVRSLRYSIQYRRVTIEGRRATVDVRYDISYQIATDMGDKWERKQSDKRLELENDGRRWLFLSGY